MGYIKSIVIGHWRCIEERTYPNLPLQRGCAFPTQQISQKRRLLRTIVEDDADQVVQHTALSLAIYRGQTRCEAH